MWVAGVISFVVVFSVVYGVVTWLLNRRKDIGPLDFDQSNRDDDYRNSPARSWHPMNIWHEPSRSDHHDI
jgi:hypothetical protein